MAEYVDAPRLRYRRILVPMMAFLFAGGQQRRIDIAYWAVTLLFVFLGAYWMSRLAELYGRSPAWALVVGLTPAVLWSIDRMTVDGALLALTAAFALYTRDEKHPWRVYLTLAAAALARETGLLLTAGYILPLLIERRYKRAMQFASAALPALAWYYYVALRTPPVPRPGLAIPFSGLLDRLLNPVPYPFSPGLTLAIRSFDYLALAGIVLAIALTIRLTWRFWKTAYGVSLVLFVALCIFVWIPGDWGMAIDYTRILSPLFLLLAVHSLRSGSWLAAAPLAMSIPRCLIQLAPQVPAVSRDSSGYPEIWHTSILFNHSVTRRRPDLWGTWSLSRTTRFLPPMQATLSRV